VSRTRSLRLTNVRIIDGTGAPPLSEGVLDVSPDGRIGFVGSAVEAPDAVDAEVRDLQGRTLLPGLIDCHVHLGMSLSDGPFHAVQNDPALLVLESAARIRSTLDAGVTSARDLGGLSLGFREAIDSGLIAGPRLKLAIRPISHTAGHGDMHLHGGTVVHTVPELIELADTVDEVRKATRRALRDGADLVKICTTGGMGSRHDHPDDEGLRLDEVRAIVDELDRHGGKPIAAHAQGRKGILTAIRGGVTSIEHGYGIDDEGLDLMEERGTFLVPTLSTLFAIDKETMQPYHYAKKVQWAEITKENIGHAIARGAKIALGTDAGVPARTEPGRTRIPCPAGHVADGRHHRRYPNGLGTPRYRRPGRNPRAGQARGPRRHRRRSIARDQDFGRPIANRDRRQSRHRREGSREDTQQDNGSVTVE
jgi:imidazolonepropionase-like amidohydrolase